MINEKKLRSELTMLRAHIDSALAICVKLEEQLQVNNDNKPNRLTKTQKAKLEGQALAARILAKRKSGA
ncbi:MAG TPA: hypothetical protein VD794_08620 [Flavisolibacter sp.]|nr:hypothetical protein [Flavisolibacter sp.]